MTPPSNVRVVVWHQRSPVVYRYLESQFIDRFFETGEIRLSSFQKFKSHKDEHRRDMSEGVAISTVIGNNMAAVAVTKHATNALVMSTSLEHSEQLYRAFEVDGCFVINNPAQFGLAICRQIPGCVAGMEGPCIYSEFRVVERNAPTMTLKDFGVDTSHPPPAVTGPTSLNHEDMNKVGAPLATLLGDDPVFLKGQAYAAQREYRLVWYLEKNVEAPETLTVTCPEAVQFCSRLR